MADGLDIWNSLRSLFILCLNIHKQIHTFWHSLPACILPPLDSKIPPTSSLFLSENPICIIFGTLFEFAPVPFEFLALPLPRISLVEIYEQIEFTVNFLGESLNDWVGCSRVTTRVFIVNTNYFRRWVSRWVLGTCKLLWTMDRSLFVFILVHLSL